MAVDVEHWVTAVERSTYGVDLDILASCTKAAERALQAGLRLLAHGERLLRRLGCRWHHVRAEASRFNQNISIRIVDSDLLQFLGVETGARLWAWEQIQARFIVKVWSDTKH